MAVVASDRLTLATLPSPSYVRTYYLKQSSTLNPPGVPTTNPPGDNWSTTEPTFSPNETATVYTVMLTAYGSVSFEYGPVQKSSSFEAAKQAYNQAISAGNSASEAYQKALDAQNDLANLQIGGRNLIRDSGEFVENQRYDVARYDLATPTVPGQKYTYQIKGALPEGKTRFLFYGRDGSPFGAYIEHTQVYDEETGIYSQTFTANQEVDGVRVYSYPSTTEATTTIEWVKLERGTKATDWTPAPEDVDADMGLLADEVALKAQIHYGGNEPSDKSALWVKDGVPHVYVDYGEEAYTWVNRAQGLANWTGRGFEYRDGVIYLTNNTASVRMPAVETDGANYIRHVELYKPVGVSLVRPASGRIYRSSYYFDADGNSVQNTSGHSSNGNAGFADEGVWAWYDWGMTGGPQVQSLEMVTRLHTDWTGDQAYIAGVHVFTNDDPEPGVFFDGNTPGFKWDGEPNASTSSYAGPGWYPVRDHDAASAIASVQKGVSEAREKAEDALAQLVNKPDKSYVDDQIIQSANGKNKITTSLNAPSGTGINGDLWRRHDSAGHVYQEFTWRDGGWKPTMVTSEMVTNMDIHKLTVSGDATFTTAVADEIWSKVVRARLVVATELIAGDAIVKGSLSADRLKAKTITAESGVIDDLAIKEAHIGNASVTNAKIKDINAGKITSGYIDAARIESRTIAAEKLLLGSFDNFFHDPRFEDERGYSPGVVVGETLRLNAGQTVNVSWLAMPVDKNESYTVRFRKTGTGSLTFAIHSATTPSGPYSLVGDSFNTYTEEGDFGFTVTADKPYIRWVASNTTAQSFISDIKIQKVFTGIRLEDGIITTEKIQSGAVVADSISADSITSEHMGANSVTAQSIGANQITGDHISAGTITGEHIEAESISAVNIGAEAITTEKLHAGAVTYEKIELGAVRGDNLGDITKDQFMSAVDGDLSNIIDSAETIADSIVISPGEIRLTTETTTGSDGVARNYLSLPASFTDGTLYDSHYNFSASQNSTITVSITLRADKPNSRFNFDLTRRGETLKVISNALVPTEWTTITGTAIAPLTDNYYIDLFMFNASTGTQRAAAIDIAEVRIQGAIPNGNFENGDLHWNLPTGAEIKSLGATTNETALSLTSTRQTFIVDGKDVVYIDSEEESMNIRNVVVDDSIRVGNHIIEKISDDITAFMWAGDRK